ncbi:MAG: PilN domain-containing protein [Phascolarctobacterium sp.]
MKQERNLQVWRNLRSQWLKKGRQHKQLVLVRLSSTVVEVGCWQADCCLWHKEKDLLNSGHGTSHEWWQELERALQDIFIWARVPEMVDTIFLLEEELVFSELLELPALQEKQLLLAIAWEAEQLVPWEEGSYHTAFAATEAGEDKLQVQLWAWPKEQAQRAYQLASGLHLHLQGILVGMGCEKAQQAWYKGYNLKHWSLEDGAFNWQQHTGDFLASDYPKKLGKAGIALSLALYVAAQAGCYWASRSLEATQQEIMQYHVWQQRLERSQKLERDLQKYRQLDKSLQGNASHMAGMVARLGQRVSAGCWLELLRSDAQSKTWQLEGSCYEAAAMNRFIENMEQDPKLQQVQLLSSQQLGNKQLFSLMVKEK